MGAKRTRGTDRKMEPSLGGNYATITILLLLEYDIPLTLLLVTGYRLSAWVTWPERGRSQEARGGLHPADRGRGSHQTRLD